MTNNEFHENEFENTDIDRMEGESTAAQPGSFRGNLSQAWRTRPMFKLLVLMIIAGAVVAASVSFFSSHKAPIEASQIVNPPNVHEAPGGPASPFVQQQTKLADEQRAQEALERNGSALPTPLGQNSDIGDLLNRSKIDPLNELRAQLQKLQGEQQQTQQKMQQQQQVQAQQQKPPEQFDDTLAQAMQRQMQQLMEGWTPHGIKDVEVTKLSELKEEKQAQAASAAASEANARPAGEARMIVPAGTVSYGQLLTEANSDVPGPILAQIVSGPFAGARATGSFQVANNYADYLVLQFSLVVLKGKEYQINAVALDPNTTLGGLATEVDQRYFTRLVLPAAAGFLQGFGQALGQNSITTTTNGNFAITQQSKAGIEQGVFYGMGDAANTASQFFQNQANLTKPLVRVAAGTPIGLFFVTSVRDTTNLPPGSYVLPNGQIANGVPGQLNPYGLSSYGIAGANPYGVPGYGTGVNPYAAANPYGMAGAGAVPGAAGYPGTTVAGYGASNTAGGMPYSNYATPATPNTSGLTTPGGNFSIQPGVGSYGYH